VAKTTVVAKAKSGLRTKSHAKATVSARTKANANAAATAKQKSARATGGESRETAALKAKFQRERSAFERRLTEAVREIGILRHHELRAMQLERQLADRDATIVRLQAQLGELERRPSEPVYVHEVQQSLALGAPVHHLHAGHSSGFDHPPTDLDEFEEDRLEDDADLVSDDD
jgi:hypothetical protein